MRNGVFSKTVPLTLLLASGLIIGSVIGLAGSKQAADERYSIPASEQTEPVLRLSFAPTSLPIGYSVEIYADQRAIFEVATQGNPPVQRTEFTLSESEKEELFGAMTSEHLSEFDAERVYQKQEQLAGDRHQAPSGEWDQPLLVVDLRVQDNASGENREIRKHIEIYAAREHARLFPSVEEYRELAKLEGWLALQWSRLRKP